MLKRQFSHIWSLETCLKASNLSFKTARGNFIQVLNRDPQKGGSHWLTLSTMKMKSLNEIKIFDSAFTSMSFLTQRVVCQLLKDGPPKRGYKILLKFIDCAYQNNSVDCGLYAIAKAVAEAFGIDLTTQEYDTELMRGHLIHCLEQKCLNPKRKKKDYFTVDNHTVFEIGSCNYCTLKNDICLLHVSFQCQSKYPSKVSAKKVIIVLFSLFLNVK